MPMREKDYTWPEQAESIYASRAKPAPESELKPTAVEAAIIADVVAHYEA